MEQHQVEAQSGLSEATHPGYDLGSTRKVMRLEFEGAAHANDAGVAQGGDPREVVGQLGMLDRGPGHDRRDAARTIGLLTEPGELREAVGARRRGFDADRGIDALRRRDLVEVADWIGAVQRGDPLEQ